MLPRGKHNIQKLRIRQTLRLIRQEKLATANSPILD
jgi:hypothetical protein